MTKRLRILTVINELNFGGDENRLLSFAKTIDRSRFAHFIVCLKKRDEEDDATFGTLRNEFAAAGLAIYDVCEDRASTSSRSRVGRLARAVQIVARSVGKVIRLIRDLKADIVDAHLDTGSTIGVLAAIATRKPCVITDYQVEPLSQQWEPLMVWRLRTQITRCLANAIITDSDASRDDFRRWVLRKNVNIFVIPNGIAPPAKTRSASEVRASIGMPEDSSLPVIGQISSLVPYKGHAVLLEAVRLVLQQHAAHLLIVGFARDAEDQVYLRELKTRALSLGMSDNVSLVSYPGPIGDVWQLIDIHAHAALVDSLPNAIIEGMALGKPAVVTSAGGIPTMVEHGVTGFVVPTNDPRALAEALLALLRDPEATQRLGRAAFDRYCSRYTAEAMTRRIEDLLTNVCEGH